MNRCLITTNEFLYNLMNRYTCLPVGQYETRTYSGVRGAPHRLIPVRPTTRLCCVALILLY